MNHFGYTDIIFIFAILLLLLGTIKMPEIARSLEISLKQDRDQKSQKQLLKELKNKKLH